MPALNAGGNDTQVNNPGYYTDPSNPTGYAGADALPPPATGSTPAPLPNPYDPSRSTQPTGQPAVQGGQYPTDASGWQGFNGNPEDPGAIAAYVKWLSTQPDAVSTLATDPNYWINKIEGTGGLTPDDVGYWDGRATNAADAAEAAAMGQGGGQNGSGLSGQQILDEMNQIFGAGAMTGPTASQTNPDLMSYLNGILKDPSSLLDKGLINSEVMNARDQEEQNRNVNTQSLESQLAARGIAGGGAEGTGLENLTAQLANIFGQNVTTINTNAAAQAEDQLKNAVTSATGLSEADAQNLISQYEATSNRAAGVAGAENSADSILNSFLLGEGNLATQNNAQSIGAQEFADTFGMNQELQAFQQGNITSDQLLQWLKDNYSGVQTSAGGFIG